MVVEGFERFGGGFGEGMVVGGSGITDGGLPGVLFDFSVGWVEGGISGVGWKSARKLSSGSIRSSSSVKIPWGISGGNSSTGSSGSGAGG